jgi:hypothetical protein
LASAMDEPQLALVSFTLHPRAHHEPRALSSRLRLLPRQELHQDEVDVELRPLQPLGHAAVVVLLHPSTPNLLLSTRDDEGFNLVVVAHQTAHWSAVPAVAAVLGGRRRRHRRRGPRGRG